jgi:hypothetical protein
MAVDLAWERGAANAILFFPDKQISHIVLWKTGMGTGLSYLLINKEVTNPVIASVDCSWLTVLGSRC